MVLSKEYLNQIADIDFVAGEVILLDKPYNWTSFDIVKKTCALIEQFASVKKPKVGHAGTLDPLATGLMILCTGKKTKEIDKYQALEKEYIATIHVGATRPTFDLESIIDQTYETNHITKELLISTLQNFIGKQEQLAPSFSAKKVNGHRAYEKARLGQSIDIKPSNIEIFEIELLEFALPKVIFRVKCSKGTYIRSLANDIGVALKSGAYLADLQRTKIGNIDISQALTLEEFKNILVKNESK